MKSLRKYGKVLALIGLTVAGSAALAHPAHADGRDRGRDWHDHEVHARDWHRIHPEPVEGVVYAPPAVVYAPPEPSPGINLVLPLNFR